MAVGIKIEKPEKTEKPEKPEKPEKTEKKSIHAGHRERLRERLRSEGLSAFSEHEVLELLLTYAIPQRDVNPLAHELIARFGSLSNVLDADESELLRVSGVGRHAALLLSMMPQLMRRYQLSALGEKPVVTTLAEAKAYCGPLFRGAHQEHLYLICLDQGGHVLHLSLLHTGTVDAVAMYPRVIVETALRHHAHAVLLAHNHPSGITEPSQADYDSTCEVIRALSTVGIKLIDHLIFAGGDAFSMIRSSQYGNMTPDSEISYMLQSRNVPGLRGVLREEQDGWVCLSLQTLRRGG